MKSTKRLLPLVVSASILALIYWQIDIESLWRALRSVDGPMLVAALLLVAPTLALTGYRLQRLAPSESGIGFLEAVRLTLAASVMNMVFPSKMGDVAKSYFIVKRGALDGASALSLVVFEKSCDMLALIAWCAFGLLVLPKEHWIFWPLAGIVTVGAVLLGALLRSVRVARFVFAWAKRLTPGVVAGRVERLEAAWIAMLRSVWTDRDRARFVGLLSVFLWFVHLVQIWMFLLALHAAVPFVVSLGLTPLAILAGLVPMTFAGIGTRDAALIFFYQPYISAAVGAGLGVLCTLRYVIPALLGLPFFGRYVALLREPSDAASPPEPGPGDA